MADVAAMLDSSRIVTLTGPGGIGKTRVAIAVGHRLVGSFPDGVVFVDLAPLRDPVLVLPTIAAAVGVREGDGRPIRDALVDALRSRRLLLIVDNVEQVADATPEISHLVAACASLRVLATSREPLRLTGEAEYPLAPLPLPEDTSAIERLRDNPSVALFVQRARQARPGFDLTPENAATIAAVCGRLDGLPLAIELAAARSRVLTPQALLARLDDPLRFLTGGARDLPDRQRTMRDTIQWSYDLLTPEEQCLFQRLSVFVGGWTVESAGAVVNADGDLGIDALDGLASLVEKSLAVQREQPGGEVRFDMLGTLREFGSERLVAEREADTTYRRHATYFATVAEEFQTGYWGSEQAGWLDRLETERDNVRTAFDTLFQQDEMRIAITMFAALRNFWWDRGPYGEPQRWFDTLLPRLPSAPPVHQASAYNAAGFLAAARRDLVLARSYHEQSLALFERIGDRAGIAAAAWGLSRISLVTDERAEAKAMITRALELFRALGERSGICGAAEDLASVLLDEGDVTAAVALLDEALSIAREDNNGILQVGALAALGVAEWQQGRARAAADRWREALRLNVQVRDLHHFAECFEGLAMVAASDLQAERAARLVGASDTIREHLPAPRSEREVERLERAIASVRDTLGPMAFAAAVAAGSDMPLDTAIVYGLDTAEP
jgi:predicted ATPase